MFHQYSIIRKSIRLLLKRQRLAVSNSCKQLQILRKPPRRTQLRTRRKSVGEAFGKSVVNQSQSAPTAFARGSLRGSSGGDRVRCPRALAPHWRNSLAAKKLGRPLPCGASSSAQKRPRRTRHWHAALFSGGPRARLVRGRREAAPRPRPRDIGRARGRGAAGSRRNLDWRAGGARRAETRRKLKLPPWERTAAASRPGARALSLPRGLLAPFFYSCSGGPHPAQRRYPTTAI